MPTRNSWGFDTKKIDTTVRPQDDFYNYALGTWLKSAKIPANESRWGSFNKLRHKTDEQLHTLLNELEAQKKVAPGSAEQIIRDMFRSGMDMDRRNALGTKPLEPLRLLVSSITSKETLLKNLATLHRRGVGALWSTGIDQDFKNAERYQICVGQGGIGLPDRDYYLLDGPEQLRVRTAYIAFMKKLLVLVGYTKASAETASATIMAIETRLAKASMPREDMRDPHKLHHPYTLSKFKKFTPSIAWDQYFTIMGISIGDLNVTQPAFLTEAEHLINTLNLEELKTYLDWCVVSDYSGLLGENFIKVNFDFYARTLAGTKTMRPLWRRVLGTVNGVAGELVGQIYVERYFSPEAKKKVNAIVDDLFTAYESRIKELDWMTPQTKKKALIKLRAMARKLGYPDKWRSYKGLVISPTDYFGNVVRATEYEHKRAVKKLAKPVDRSEWYDYPQTVNAFYNPPMNDMLFPAAILQHPFFDLSADDAVNYGAMGAVIGHEMSHGFDNDGAKFDHKGNVKNWWSESDRKSFEAKGKLLQKQYSEFVVAGLPVNGKLTLGENIADLGGLMIALDAYHLQLERTERRDIDGFTPEQRFFLGYAQFEEEIARPEITKLAILTDEHSPSICRVNGVMSNSEAFYSAWGVKKGDKLFRPSNKRARVW